MTPTGPRDIQAVTLKIIDFLETDTASSLEVQIAALRVASTLLEETISVNSRNDMKNEVRNFWRRK